MYEINNTNGSLYGEPVNLQIARAMVRVLGSIAVTLAAMLDHMRKDQ